MIPLLVLFAVVGTAAAAAASSGASEPAGTPLERLRSVPLTLEQRFAAQAKRGAAERAQREKDSRAEIERQRKFWSKVPWFGAYFSAAYAALAPVMEGMIDFGKAISQWNAPDWNSAAEQARVKAVLQRYADVRLLPPNPMPDDEFKTYADLAERSLAPLDALWVAKPENLMFWRALVGWVESNAKLPAVQDVLQLRLPDGRGIMRAVWPVRGDLRSSSPDAVLPDALAIATLAAAMRGKDAATVREAVREWQRYAMKMQPELRLHDNLGWYFGGLLDAVDRATR